MLKFGLWKTFLVQRSPFFSPPLHSFVYKQSNKHTYTLFFLPITSGLVAFFRVTSLAVNKSVGIFTYSWSPVIKQFLFHSLAKTTDFVTILTLSDFRFQGLCIFLNTYLENTKSPKNFEATFVYFWLQVCKRCDNFRSCGWTNPSKVRKYVPQGYLKKTGIL